MRIGFFTDNYLPSRDGIAISVDIFKTELEKMGHKVFVIAPAPSLIYKEESDHILRFPAFKGLFYEDYLTSVFSPSKALKQIDELNLDIVHYHTLGQVGFLGAYYGMKRNLPLLTTYHTDYYQYVKHYKNTLPGVIALSLLAPAITGGKLQDYRKALLNIRPEKTVDDYNQKLVEKGVKTMLDACDIVIAPSKKIKDQLTSWETHTEIDILPTGVDKIKTTDDDIKDWENKLGITKEDKVIAFVGRLGSEKNLDLLLSSYDEIRSNVANVKLLVIGGTGSQTEEADIDKKKVMEGYKNKGIIFTGYVKHDQLGALYGLSDIFAFPSMTDTQGLVLNEAAMSGLPIVMIDKDITMIVRNDINGKIVKEDKTELANAIITILNDNKLRSKMSRASVELAKDYSQKNQALKIERIYNNLIKKYEGKIHLNDN
ncbi:MAG: glycosyltransferase [bacterium]|jgi:1,2-diacylglycerol 3-alpha-glucosyltransferase